MAVYAGVVALAVVAKTINEVQYLEDAAIKVESVWLKYNRLSLAKKKRKYSTFLG